MAFDLNTEFDEMLTRFKHDWLPFAKTLPEYTGMSDDDVIADGVAGLMKVLAERGAIRMQ